jgi:hypothetical protein
MDGKEHQGYGILRGMKREAERRRNQPCQKCGGSGLISDPATLDPPWPCSRCQSSASISEDPGECVDMGYHQARDALAEVTADRDRLREALEDIVALGCTCDKNYPGSCGCREATVDIAESALDQIVSGHDPNTVSDGDPCKPPQ